jgi:hypothetical protein
MMQDVHVTLNTGLSWQKQHSTGRRLFCTSKLDLNLRKKLVKCYIWSIALYGAESWTLWKVLKCGAGEGWRRSAGLIV